MKQIYVWLVMLFVVGGQAISQDNCNQNPCSQFQLGCDPQMISRNCNCGPWDTTYMDVQVNSRCLLLVQYSMRRCTSSVPNDPNCPCCQVRIHWLWPWACAKGGCEWLDVDDYLDQVENAIMQSYLLGGPCAPRRFLGEGYVAVYRPACWRLTGVGGQYPPGFPGEPTGWRQQEPPWFGPCNQTPCCIRVYRYLYGRDPVSGRYTRQYTVECETSIPSVIVCDPPCFKVCP
jgi:hypothetical protein